MKKKTHTGYRDARTGLFVSEAYAKSHKSTTVKESVPNPGHGLSDRKKKK